MPKSSPAREQYYAKLRKLTQEQIDEAYNLYYYPKGRQPTLASVGASYGVAASTMFRILHNERTRRISINMPT